MPVDTGDYRPRFTDDVNFHVEVRGADPNGGSSVCLYEDDIHLDPETLEDDAQAWATHHGFTPDGTVWYESGTVAVYVEEEAS